MKLAYSFGARMGDAGCGEIARIEAEAFSEHFEVHQVFAPSFAPDALDPARRRAVFVPWIPGLGRFWWGKRWLWWFRAWWFDRLVAGNLGDCDLFFGWAFQSLRSLEAARGRGALGAIERGNSHIREELALHREEHARLGVGRASLFDSERIVERSLAEYEVADLLVVPSRFVADSFERCGVPPERILRMPLGMDTERFSPGPWPRSGPLRLVFVGRVTPIKGLHDLVAAFRAADLPEATLRILGGDLSPPDFLDTGGDPRIQFVGFRSRDEVAEEFRRAHLVVVPSIEDGYNRVVTEAMACATPVLATENVGAAEWIRPGLDGDVVPIRDPEALAESMMRLLSDRDALAEKGAAAAARVRGFTWSWYTGELARVLRARREGEPAQPILPEGAAE